MGPRNRRHGLIASLCAMAAFSMGCTSSPHVGPTRCGSSGECTADQVCVIYPGDGDISSGSQVCRARPAGCAPDDCAPGACCSAGCVQDLCGNCLFARVEQGVLHCL